MAIEVSNLNNSGLGSLRAAIEVANAAAGRDEIVFADGLTGTLTLSSALPQITGRVAIKALADGQSTPVIQIDFAGHAGLTFAEGSGGSSLIGLSLVGASGDALTLISSNNTLQDNYIGVDLDGTTVHANQGNGITITASSTGNLIGSTTPADSTTWNAITQAGEFTIGTVQGIRYGTATDDYILCGTGNQGASPQNVGLVFLGEADGSDGSWYEVNAATAFGGSNTGANASITSCYGPEQLDRDTIRVVGSYNADASAADIAGFIYTGKVDAADNTTAGFIRYQYPGSQWTFFHSTQEGLVVGNWDVSAPPDTTKPLIGLGKAFIYDVDSATAIADIQYPGSHSTTAYGIAKVNANLFAITGSYSISGEGNNTGHGYLVYYHRDTNSFSDWTSWDIDDPRLGNIVSHADGISYNSTDNTFTLATAALQVAPGNAPVGGYLMTVDREADGGFGAMRWTEVSYNNGSSGVTIPTSVAGDVMTGEYSAGGTVTSWSSQTTYSTDPSNVISGNAGHGIAILDSTLALGVNNTIAQNRIGTNADGTAAQANGGNGILIDGASRNLIGGTITGGNDPTKGITTAPPLGNLISGNTLNGVLITDGASHNTLSGNFIGTSVSGNQKLANGADGVAIVEADENALLGCQLESSPFVYYNVVSGNTANGLRISNSDNTTIHANFFGLAANNQDPLGNGLNGALIEGTSANTQYGGVIPLGNVNSGNGANGIEVKDQATGFITFNTFAGTTAFGGIAPNLGDGMLFTSTGGDNTIRTNVIGGNIGNGIRIAGSASGITVDPNIIGLNSFGTADTYVSNTGEVVSYGNQGDGIRVEGAASAITIAGTYASVIPQNTISNNDGYGIRVTGTASDVRIANTAIGTGSIVGDEALQFGNRLGGVFIGGSAQATVGDPSAVTQTLLANNFGSGLTIEGSLNNQISHTEFRNNSTYGLSFLGLDAIEADRQSGEGLSFISNADGAVQIAPGWANLSLTKAVGSDRFSLTADSTISVLRLDTGAEGIRFGIENAASGSSLDLVALVAASDQSLNLDKILAGTWTETEGVALGGRTASAVAADTWIPIATDAAGQRLTLESLVLSGNSATARFAGGVEAVYAVGGSGLLASSIADGSLAIVSATVKRLGAFNNGLALYEADPLTGAVDGLLPGDQGYLQAALQAAKREGTVFSAQQLPGYGESGNLNLTLSPEENYGFLLISDGNENKLYSSYSAANPDGAVQITSYTTPDGALTFGFEDTLTNSRKSDQDFNDLILSIEPAAEESARIPNSNPWIRPDQQSYFQLDELIPEARDLYEDLQKGENAFFDEENVFTIELILKRREVDRSAVESSGQYSFQRFYDTDELLSLSYQELQSYTSQLSEQDLIDLYGADEQTIQDVVGFLQRSGATNINHDSAKEQRTLSFDISLANFLTAFTDGKQNLLNPEDYASSYSMLYKWIGTGGPSESYLTAVGEGAEAFADAILGLEILPAKANTTDADSNSASSSDALENYSFYPIDIAKTYNYPGTDLATVGNGARIGLVGSGGNKAMLGWKDSDAYSQYLEAQGRNPNLAADIRSLDASVADYDIGDEIGGEQMLDISVLASVAPGAEIVASAYVDPLSDALELYKNYAQLIYLDDENSVDVISSSVQDLSNINYFSQATDELFLDAVLRGIPIVVAAGDRGTANPNGEGLKFGLGTPLFNQSTGSAAVLSVGGTAFNKEAISLSPDGSSNTASSADNQTTWNELNPFQGINPELNFLLGDNYESDAWSVADILQKPDAVFFEGDNGLWQGIASSGSWDESSDLLGAGYQRDNLTGEWQDVWRSYPDISMLAGGNAANGTGGQSYKDVAYFGDEKYSIGGSEGTSASAPLTAALLAIAASELKQKHGDDAKLGFINPLLYQLYNSAARDQVFFDVPAGSNNANVYSTPATPEEWDGVYVAFEEIQNSDGTLEEVQLYPLNGTLPNGDLNTNLSSTGPGFDAATGLGSLNGQGFLDQLLAIYGTL